ncbi:MAG TPA: hypothetical protein VLC98_12760 [Phnomibacter sp.]|nr:hypothetical protein [Phnomibacter sp.]
MNRTVPILFCFIVFISCGDLLSEKKKVYENYYLIESEDQRVFSLCYRSKDDDFIERVSSPVVGYFIAGDSLFIAKREVSKQTVYYVIDIKKDNSFADADIYTVGLFKENEFKKWSYNKSIKPVFIDVK